MEYFKRYILLDYLRILHQRLGNKWDDSKEERLLSNGLLISLKKVWRTVQIAITEGKNRICWRVWYCEPKSYKLKLLGGHAFEPHHHMFISQITKPMCKPKKRGYMWGWVLESMIYAVNPNPMAMFDSRKIWGKM